jgi:predicted Zn-dependent peptidase
LTAEYFEHTLANGLHLLVEQRPDVRCAAFTFLVPCGVIADPAFANGAANLLSDLVTRGAGARNHRQLTLDLDNLGLQRSESTEIYHTSFTVAALASNLATALELFADIIRSPHLEAEQLEYCRQTALQELAAIEDEPTQKVFIELKRRALPDRLGRPILGLKSDITRVDRSTLRALHEQWYRPNGAILGVAGAVEFPQVRDHVIRLFSDWRTQPAEFVDGGTRSVGRYHIHSDKVQTYIGVAWPSVAFNDPDYFNAHGAVGVLSGGMSGRLFTELRERRGLCYSIGASLYPLKSLGMIACYTGTTNDRAQDTLEVLLEELRRLPRDIRDDEVRRVRAGLKSAMVMQEESTAARASILARSWFHLGRVRTLEETAREIDRISPARIAAYLERCPPSDFTILTLGPKELETHR